MASRSRPRTRATRVLRLGWEWAERMFHVRRWCSRRRMSRRRGGEAQHGHGERGVAFRAWQRLRLRQALSVAACRGRRSGHPICEVLRAGWQVRSTQQMFHVRRPQPMSRRARVAAGRATRDGRSRPVCVHTQVPCARSCWDRHGPVRNPAAGSMFHVLPYGETTSACPSRDGRRGTNPPGWSAMPGRATEHHFRLQGPVEEREPSPAIRGE
jgi:hypothetical protein